MEIDGYSFTFTYNTVTFGCTTVTRSQIMEILKHMDKAKKPKFPIGSKVCVIGKFKDDAKVTGRTGIVVSGNGEDGILVRFPGWHSGHDGGTGKGTSHWWVSVRGIKKVRG